MSKGINAFIFPFPISDSPALRIMLFIRSRRALRLSGHTVAFIVVGTRFVFSTLSPTLSVNTIYGFPQTRKTNGELLL